MQNITDKSIDEAIRVYDSWPIKDGNEDDKRYRMLCAIRAAIYEMEKHPQNVQQDDVQEDYDI